MITKLKIATVVFMILSYRLGQPVKFPFDDITHQGQNLFDFLLLCTLIFKRIPRIFALESVN